MPETTPIYAFPYPCEDEPVDAVAFANLANAIDAKLFELSVDEREALNRYNQTLSSANNVVNPGVDTVIAGANSTYTIPVDGVWQVIATTVTSAIPATFTSTRIRVRKSAVPQFGMRRNPETAFYDLQANGTFTAIAGDTVSFQVLYTGTGTWTMSVDWRVMMHVRIA